MNAPTQQTIMRRAARVGIRPDDLEDAAQAAQLAIVEERPEPHHVNAVISRRLIDYARREYGQKDNERGKRRSGYRRSHGLANMSDYDTRDAIGRSVFHHLNATADHADHVAARVDMAELIRRADSRLSDKMIRVLIGDVQDQTPAEIRAALNVSMSRVQQLRNRAYEIIRSVA